MRKGIFAALAVVVAMAGCAAAPTRDDAGAYTLLDEGAVPQVVVPRFAGCLMDGLDKAYGATGFQSRQQRRSDSVRIDTMNLRWIVFSFDIFDSGAVRFYRANPINTIWGRPMNADTERAAFSNCLKLYARS